MRDSFFIDFGAFFILSGILNCWLLNIAEPESWRKLILRIMDPFRNRGEAYVRMQAVFMIVLGLMFVTIGIVRFVNTK